MIRTKTGHYLCPWKKKRNRTCMPRMTATERHLRCISPRMHTWDCSAEVLWWQRSSTTLLYDWNQKTLSGFTLFHIYFTLHTTNYGCTTTGENHSSGYKQRSLALKDVNETQTVFTWNAAFSSVWVLSVLSCDLFNLQQSSDRRKMGKHVVMLWC